MNLMARPKPITTHWSTDGELHAGSLDDCRSDACVDRRSLVFEHAPGR